MVRKYLWGNPASKMIGTYSHLTDADIDDAMLASAGFRSRERTASTAMDARECRRCLTVNPPTADLCWRCGSPLTEEVASSLEELRREIEKTAGRVPGDREDRRVSDSAWCGHDEPGRPTQPGILGQNGQIARIPS